ncbi:restriction endonuclease subunit S [Agathobacter rectalis]|uniref:Restriction endonuclease subunit S n=1 Tax=Agathobacter rectalis TaxID=39491 RepID=A0AAP3Q0Z5_9FIRM|nr:restriction endonuclease subunit S [Agathobacter rectalis]MDB8016877.1 restriction endonuclease subunit S [Agathobacter rectalis]
MAKDIIKLGDVATYINGYAFKPEDRGEEGLQIIRIQDLTGNSYDLGFYNGKYPKKIEINDGDVLISWSASLGVYVWNGGKALLNQHIFKVKFDKVDIDKSYFVYAVRYKLNDMGKKTHGATMKHIVKRDFDATEIPYPPLKKQIEIAINLDKVLMVIKERKRELKLLDELIKARFVEMFGDPRSNPFGFEKKRLKDTCKVITGNTPSRAIEEYYGDYIEWIKTDNIVSGILNPTQATESLSEKGMNVGRTVEKDSILMACIAGSIASIGRVCITDRTVAFNQQINAVVPEQYNILFLYVLFQMSKDYLVEDINMALKGILSKSKLEEKEFIIPPMDLQEQFSDFVKQVDKSKVAVQKALDETQILFDSLMQKYFG